MPPRTGSEGMNGAHDMGGMQSFGPVRIEKNEPVFHARWEGRIQALWSAIGTWRKWNSDHGRQTREQIPAAEYLALGYSERRYVQTVELLVEARADLARRARERTAGAWIAEGGLPAQGRGRRRVVRERQPEATRGGRRAAVSRRVSRFARATSIRKPIPDCRATCAASRVSSSATTVSSCSRTPTR